MIRTQWLQAIEEILRDMEAKRETEEYYSELKFWRLRNEIYSLIFKCNNHIALQEREGFITMEEAGDARKLLIETTKRLSVEVEAAEYYYDKRNEEDEG